MLPARCEPQELAPFILCSTNVHPYHRSLVGKLAETTKYKAPAHLPQGMYIQLCACWWIKVLKLHFGDTFSGPNLITNCSAKNYGRRHSSKNKVTICRRFQ